MTRATEPARAADAVEPAGEAMSRRLGPFERRITRRFADMPTAAVIATAAVDVLSPEH